MQIDPNAPMGFNGHIEILGYGKWFLAVCSGSDDDNEEPYTIERVFKFVCEKWNVPPHLRNLDCFRVIKIEPTKEPMLIVLEEKITSTAANGIETV